MGGTGQYVRAITEGWQVPAQQPDTRMRAALESWASEIGAEGLYRRLGHCWTRTAAAAIDWRNQRRTVRALEVIFNTGRRFSAQRTKGSLPYQFKLIGLKRERPNCTRAWMRALNTCCRMALRRGSARAAWIKATQLTRPRCPRSVIAR